MISTIKKEVDDVQFLQVIPQQRQHHRASFGIVREPPVLNFDPELKVAFAIWKRKWNSWYYMVTREGSLDSDQIFHSLMNCFSERTIEYFLNLGLDAVEEKNPELIIERLSGLVSSGKNHIVHRHEFQMRVQKSGENFDSWMAALKELADQAHFDLDCCGKCKDSRLLQQVISGVYKPETRRMLMEIGSGLTLDQAARVIRTTEFNQNNVMTSPVQNTYLEPFTPVVRTSTKTLDSIHNTSIEPIDTVSRASSITQVSRASSITQVSRASSIAIVSRASSNIKDSTQNTSIEPMTPVSSKTKTPIQNTYFEPMTPDQSHPKIFFQKAEQKIPHTTAASPEGSPLGFMNPELLSTPTAWAQSFGAEAMNEDTFTSGKSTSLKKRKLELVVDEHNSCEQTQTHTDTKKEQAFKPKTEKVSKLKNPKIPILKIKVPKSQTTKAPKSMESSKNSNAKFTKETTKQKAEAQINQEKVSTPKKCDIEEKAVGTSKEPELESRRTENDVTNSNVTARAPIKVETSSFQCHHCEKKFSLFYTLKTHKCESTKRSEPMEDSYSFCSSCEMRHPEYYLNGDGRCGACQDLFENQTNQPMSVQQVKTELQNPASINNISLVLQFDSAPNDESNENEEINNYIQEPMHPRQTYYQNDHTEISEEHLERLILESIEHLRKTRRTSSDIAIAKRVIVKDRRYNLEMIWAQMGKCIEYGLIEKLNKKNSKSYRLTGPVRMDF